MNFINRKRSKKPILINRWRRAAQTLSLFIFNPFLFQYMGVCLPVMNCWACPAAAFSCPVGVVGSFLAQGLFPYAALGMVVLGAMLLGRIFCGWICPFGFLQDLLYKIPSPKIAIPGKIGTYLFLLPLTLLIGTVVLVPMLAGTESDLYFCRFCPAGTLEAALPLHFVNSEKGLIDTAVEALLSWRVWILLAFLALFVFVTRPFCRIMCPIGVFLGFFNWISLHKIKLEQVTKCPECDLCCEACPVELNAHTDVNNKDCIHCYVCTESCPPRNVIKRKNNKKPASKALIRKTSAPHAST